MFFDNKSPSKNLLLLFFFLERSDFIYKDFFGSKTDLKPQKLRKKQE